MSKAKYAHSNTEDNKYEEDNKYALGSDSHLLNRKMAAKFLGVKEHTLAVWRMSNKYHLPYVKVGRLVKYRLTDLEKFLEENLHR